MQTKTSKVVGVLNKKLYDLLLTLDTPTVCNSIEVAQGKRGFQRFTRGTVLSSVQSGEVIVGYARTAKIAGTTPPEEEPEITRERRMNYYEYMANSSEPSIVVIEGLRLSKLYRCILGRN